MSDLILPWPLALSFPLRLEYFSWPAALGMLALLALPIVLLGMRSLNGLGRVRKWVAIGIRLAVLLLFVLILGGARWQRENKTLEVMVLRDISESTAQVRDYPGNGTLQASLDDYLTRLSDDKNREQTLKQAPDRMGVISFHSSALIDAMPSTRLMLDARAIREGGSGTDLAAAINLGLATLSKDAMHRLLLISDGNATVGDVEAAAAAAAAQNVQIDVMPLHYDVKSEVTVERMVAPTWKRENEPFSVDVILRSTNAQPTTGRLTVLHGPTPLDLDTETPGVQASKTVTLEPGLNVQHVRVPALKEAGVHQFKATFEADNVTAAVAGGAAAGGGGDTLLQNNSAGGFTFVRGKGKVLYIDNVPDGRGEVLRSALLEEGINLDRQVTGVDQFPTSLLTLQNYDSVILNNVPRGAGGISEEQQKLLASYVHDMGGGLIVIGGPDAFGAGGWQGSKLEEVLPVNMDIPAQRQLPKGALVLVMHSCEMPNGNYWGEQCAIKASETLSERDEIGIISFDWGGGGSQWDFALQPKGDGAKLKAAIKAMQLGDMPSFDDSISVALHGKDGKPGLLQSDARQKHIIVISDGDPAMPNAQLMEACRKNQISISTVTVYTHTPGTRSPQMDAMARETKGRAYGPIENNPNQLPQIFIKEATVVRRTLIQEDRKGIPLKANLSASEIMKGLEGIGLPPVYGMVLTSRKPNPQIEMPIVGGKNNDPILAHWQAGLGRAAVFTSDAHNKWAADWVGSAMYPKFWAQMVRGVSRAPMSADFDVQIVQEGNKARLVVEAMDKENTFLNFLNVSGTVVGPDADKKQQVRLEQIGPGKYEQTFDASASGNYVAMLEYRGSKGEKGVLLSGLAVNSAPELRDLKSNESMLLRVAEMTGGRVVSPFDLTNYPLFTREGLNQTSSPLPIWDLLVPVLLGLFLVDVATRRIAWDWVALKGYGSMAIERVRAFTTTRRVETTQSLDALRQIREKGARAEEEEVRLPRAPATTASKPDPKAKFEARQGVAGDITEVVGGATAKPIPSSPRKNEPKGLATTEDGGGHTGSLLEAKRRARQQMQQKEKGE